jgi:class 3 adenylate cyclase
MILNGAAEDPLKAHRRDLTIVYLDLRGFTAFTESAEPEEVMDLLHEYHDAMGQLINAYEGTLEHFAGDGMMIFFNDPVPMADAPERAVRMAIAMRERVRELAAGWKKLGFDLNFGVGIARGYTTIGAIGFDNRREYGAIGSAPNLSARLCGEAKPGEILISQRVFAGIESLVEAEPLGTLQLKGFQSPVPAYKVLGLRN